MGINGCEHCEVNRSNSDIGTRLSTSLRCSRSQSCSSFSDCACISNHDDPQPCVDPDSNQQCRSKMEHSCHSAAFQRDPHDCQRNGYCVWLEHAVEGYEHIKCHACAEFANQDACERANCQWTGATSFIEGAVSKGGSCKAPSNQEDLDQEKSDEKSWLRDNRRRWR